MADAGPDQATHLTRLLLVGRVEVDGRAVAAHDHAVADPLAVAGLEARLVEPRDELAGRGVVVELDAQA
jgi:hypothetical protein